MSNGILQEKMIEQIKTNKRNHSLVVRQLPTLYFSL